MTVRIPSLPTRSLKAVRTMDEVRRWGADADEWIRQATLTLQDLDQQGEGLTNKTTPVVSLTAHASTHEPSGSDPLAGYLTTGADDAASGTYTFSNQEPFILSGSSPITIDFGTTGTIRQTIFDSPSASINAQWILRANSNSARQLAFQVNTLANSTQMTSSGAFTFNISSGNATFNATSGNVVFNAASGNIQFTHDAVFGQAVTFDYEGISGTDSLDDTNYYAACDASGGAFTLTLPAAATAGAGRVYVIKKIDSSANAVTVDGNGSETIDGATTHVLSAQYDFVRVISNGTNWDIIG